MTNKEDRLIRFDWAAKRLLRQKSNFVILEGFLSTLFEEEIKIVHMLESESNQEREDDKYNRVDMLTKTSRGELVIIEIQNNHESDYFQRMLYGVSKAITDHIDLGERYQKIKKVYSVNIVYSDSWHGKDYIYHGRMDFLGMHSKDVFELSSSLRQQYSRETVGDLFPEYYIIRVDGFNDKAVSKMDEWIYFLKNSKLPENVSAKGLPEAGKCLSFVKLSKEEQRKYLAYMDSLHHYHGVIEAKLQEGLHEGEEIGLQKGKEIGLQKGKEIGKIEIATNALKMGLSKEDVIKLTGLTEKDLDLISI